MTNAQRPRLSRCWALVIIRLRINPCAQVRRPFGSAIADDMADCLQWKEALMKVKVRREGDRERLDELVAREKVAVQRDRLRAARLALDGGEASGIAAALGRSRRFVQEWAYAYRDGGG